MRAAANLKKGRAVYQRRFAKSARLWLAGLLGLMLAIGAQLPAEGADGKTGKKETELKDIKERIESVRKSLQADAVRRDALVGELKSADEDIQTAREQLADIRTQRQAAERQLEALAAEKAATEKRIAAERDELADELRVAYANGRGEQLKMLLNQDDPVRFGRLLVYYGYFGRARAEQIAVIKDQLAHLDLVTARIAAETDRLRQIEDSNARSAKTLAAARQKRANTLAKVEKNLKTGNERLTRLQADAAALEKLIEELRRAAREFPSLPPQAFGKVRGKLPWPVKGRLLARFGQLRSGGPLKWQGIVIGAEQGAQVRAPLGGRVVYADWLTGLGLLMILDHGNGFMTLYGHNEQLYKKVGDQVSSGDSLAAVGAAGIEGRSGLYLEVRQGKQPLNPLDWLSKP